MKFSKELQKGFTLIEVITAAFVFTVVIAGIAGIFVRATLLQRRAFAAEQIQSTTLAAIESISRDARVSDICPNVGVCTTSVLEMEHPDKGLIRYTYNSGQGIITKTEGSLTGNFTSPDVNYNDVRFTIERTNPDCRQPKIIISMTARSSKGPLIQTKVQTTVISRNFEEEFTNPFTPGSCPI